MNLSLVRALPLAIALLVPSVAFAEEPAPGPAKTATAQHGAAGKHKAHSKRAKAAPKAKKAPKASKKAPKASKKAPRASKKAANK